MQSMSLGVSKHGTTADYRPTDISLAGAELPSIKEDRNKIGKAAAGSRGGNRATELGLVQDDSIIENDQPSVMLPKGGRQAVNDYKQASPDGKTNNMGLTGDSFADSIMSNHY